MTTPVWMPADVRTWYDTIEHGTGQTPRVERIGDRRFRLTAESERVTMTLDLKMTGPGRWVWADSTLTVDGRRRELAENAAAFFRLFHNPDTGGKLPVDPADEEPFEPYPLDDPPPPAVQNIVGQLTGRLAQLDVAVEAGRLADGTPLVVVTFARGYLRVKVTTTVRMRAVVDGYDVTDGTTDSVGEVLRKLMDALDPAQAAPAATGRVRRASATQRNTSVEVRRQSVIRT